MLVPQRIALSTQHLKKNPSRLPLPFLTTFLGFEQGPQSLPHAKRARS